MRAARQQKIDESDPAFWVPPLREALAEALVEAMTLGSPARVDETMRRWLADVRPRNAPEAMEALAGEAMGLAMELSAFAPSFTGARAVDRLARRTKGLAGIQTLAPQLLQRAKFRLFSIAARIDGDVFRVRDLATGETFRLFEPRLAPNSLDCELAARICPIPQDLNVFVGPVLALGGAGMPAARDFIRPGKGIGDDQRCAAVVYRDYIRRSVAGGLNFGLRPPQAPFRLSCPELELDAFAQAWLAKGGGLELSGGALVDARNLTSGPRLTAALCSSLELRAVGQTQLADIYRVLAAIQIETLHQRGRIGSGETSPLDRLRASMVGAIAAKRCRSESLALFDELALPFRGRGKRSANADDDLARVIERIRALRAKTTEQGCTEQEALRAAEKVAELLERYGLSLSEIELRKQTCEGFGVDTGRRKREPSDRCIQSIAEFCDCRVWSETSASGMIRFVFFGLPADVEAAHYLYDLVGVAFHTETESFKRGALFANMHGAERRGAAASFQIGLATGITDKLTKLKTQRQAAMFKSSGRDLLPVKASILDEEIEKLGLNFKTSRSVRRRRVIAAAYAEGEAAGGKFEVRRGIK